MSWIARASGMLGFASQLSEKILWQQQAAGQRHRGNSAGRL